MAAHGPNRNLRDADSRPARALQADRRDARRLEDHAARPPGAAGRAGRRVAGQPPSKDGRSSDHERHYGKKTRDTSWFG
jgi:hypothetical protein